MEKVKTAFRNTTDHVIKYRGRYCALATATIAVLVINRHIRNFETFLVSKNIDPTEYFLLELYEETLKNKAL